MHYCAVYSYFSVCGLANKYPVSFSQHFQLALIDSNPCTLSKAESEYISYLEFLLKQFTRE